jgi:O-antigen ligase
VLYQRLELDVDRPGGLINAITYGDLSLCLGLVALTAALDFRSARKAVWPAIGAVAGILGSIATGTRGGWVALVLVALVFAVYSHVLSSRRVRALIALSFALVAGTYFIPGTGVRERIGQGVSDVTTYFGGGSAFSNVGIRLELWKSATLLMAEKPIAGRDLGTARKQLRTYVAEGRIDKAVLDAPHFHNDPLQALVTGGVIGFAAWLAILAAPFAFFARALSRHANPGRGQFALALAGMVVVVSYFSFGLTEVIFWSVKGSLFYTLMIFMLMGLCLNAKDNDGK